MRHANRKPESGPGRPECAMGPAQSYGHCSVNGTECVMRRMLTVAALALAMLGAGVLPRCDSGCIANAEDRRPAPVPVQDEQRRHVRQPVDYIYPPPVGEEQRGPLRGDFWTPAEFERVIPEGGNRSGFETIVPAR